MKDLPPRKLYIVISESDFLLFVSDVSHENLCFLEQQSSLYGLQKIERSFDVPKKITFYWQICETNVNR